MARVFLIVLDSVGIGALPDAELYGDLGAHTLSHATHALRKANIPHLLSLGLGNIKGAQLRGRVDAPIGRYGRLAEASPGKDTTTGHWELAGLILDKPFPLYPKGFPRRILDPFEKAIERGTLGNVPASGTAIIDELGAEHIRTGFPIVYTSGDSVFQIAAHESVVPPDLLYEMCRKARDLLTGEDAVGRVIARPFVGEPGAFVRTKNRRDFSLEPPGRTLLDAVQAAGQTCYGIGKIEDIFAKRGLTGSDHTGDNAAGIQATLDMMQQDFEGLVFTNLVDFDSLYGHRRDAKGYAHALEAFDAGLGEMLGRLRPGDKLLITADHGCDPIHAGTDHTREYVPLLIAGDGAGELADAPTFAVVADMVCRYLDIEWEGPYHV